MDLLFHVGSEHLEYHLFAVRLEGGGMHLRDRCRGQWRVVEIVEVGLYGGAELGLYLGAGDGGVEGGHPVLQHGQLFGPFVAQQIAAGR